MSNLSDSSSGSDVKFTPGKHERYATPAVFFTAGFATAAWASLVPYVKTNNNLGEGVLGLLLLCLGVGALVAMPISGALTARYGCRRILLLSAALFSLVLPILPLISTPSILAPFLLLFGFGIGACDSAMNIQAIIVEKSTGRPLMSGFHAYYSIGGIAGAGMLSMLLSAGFSPVQTCLICTGLFCLVMISSWKGLLNYANPPEGPTFAFPRGSVLLLGIICFLVFLGEGTVLDWSAVFLTEYRRIPEALGGLGFTCFALLMTIGRLTGDKVVTALGPQKVVLTGAVIAAAGIILSVLSSGWQAALVGYGMMGLGMANIVPVMFSAVGRQTSMPPSVAVPAVTSFAYMGVLAGPAAIGWIAHLSSLSAAFLVVSILLLGVAVLSSRVKF